MSDVEIRRARQEDLGPLARSLGQDQKAYFVDRLRRQRDNLGVLLAAWYREVPIGDVYLWLEEAEEPEIRLKLRHVPLLTHLEVHVGHRGRGVGTMLIDAVEDEVRGRGYDRIALAVRLDATRAAGLYDRLGYADWGYRPVDCVATVSTTSGPTPRLERCRVLVKKLA